MRGIFLHHASVSTTRAATTESSRCGSGDDDRSGWNARRVMSKYLRLTVLSDQRNVELMLPESVPVGELMPEVLKLTHPQSPPNPRELTLTPVGGRSLSTSQTLSDASIIDGAQIRLDRRDHAIHAPIVYDLADTTGQLTSDSAATWTIRRGRLTTIALLTMLLTVLVTGLQGQLEPDLARNIGLGISAGLLALMAGLGQELVKCDLELVIPSALIFALTQWNYRDGITSAWFESCLWFGLLVLCLAVTHRAMHTIVIAVTSMVFFGLLWWAGITWIDDLGYRGMSLATATVIIIGILPRFALILSGLTSIDDHLAAGERPQRVRISRAVSQAHEGLSTAVLVCCLSFVTGLYLLRELRDNGWAIGLGLVLLALIGLRARTMPQVIERTAMIATLLLGLVYYAWLFRNDVPGWLTMVLLIATIVIVVAVRLLQLPPHIAAWLRIAARRAEMLLAITIFPLLIGTFGIYGQLVNVF
ncbi:hypothetical protein DYI20_11520 [Auritidibacter ignavus]|nr:hypothetical protein DYI20_11520 [Auritidibacter ignavus]